MIVLFIFLIILSFFFKNILVFKSIFFFLSVLFSFLIIYYLILFFYLGRRRKDIINAFLIPEEIDNSNLIFNFKISPLYFLTNFKLNLITDKCEIAFNYNHDLACFEAIPFYRGKHKVEKFQIIFSDVIKFLSIKINLNPTIFYNYFKFGSNKMHQGMLPLTKNDTRVFKTMDDSILIRDYLFGDDVRKILWRVYAISNDIKVKTDWLEKSSSNFLPLYICGIYCEKYFFSNLIIYKIYNLIKVLIQNNFNISINGKTFDGKEDRALQRQIFSICENEKENGINFDIPQNSILIFSSIAVGKNQIKELWIPKNKSIYYVSLKDFFTVDKKNYFNTANFINLFLKKPELSKIARYYFSNYSDFDILYEKRYQII